MKLLIIFSIIFMISACQTTRSVVVFDCRMTSKVVDGKQESVCDQTRKWYERFQ